MTDLNQKKNPHMTSELTPEQEKNLKSGSKKYFTSDTFIAVFGFTAPETYSQPTKYIPMTGTALPINYN